MTAWYYHGSVTPGIRELEARSRLHGTDRQVVYLTDSVPYALFYLWDSARNGCGKYVTGGFRDGQAFYEEQFPDQLRTFYEGVSGYLYRVAPREGVHALEGRESLFWHEGSIAPADAVFIPDVYTELLKYEAAGQLRILRYLDQTEARRLELTDMIAEAIRRSRFGAGDDALRHFLMRHFRAAWQKAAADITPCGESCSACPKHASGQCRSCRETDGYCEEWAQSGRCPVYACAQAHGAAFCGVCPAFPCADLPRLLHWRPDCVQELRDLAGRLRP